MSLDDRQCQIKLKRSHIRGDHATIRADWRSPADPGDGQRLAALPEAPSRRPALSTGTTVIPRSSKSTACSITSLETRECGDCLSIAWDFDPRSGGDIRKLESRLEALADLGRLYTSGSNSSFKDCQTIRETKLQPITQRLLWAGPYTCSNFYVVLSGSGHAMLIDYGLTSLAHLHASNDHGSFQALRFVQHHLEQLRDDYGVREIELVIPTHIHDDLVCGISFLQRHFGTQCWALDCPGGHYGCPMRGRVPLVVSTCLYRCNVHCEMAKRRTIPPIMSPIFAPSA